MTIEPLDVTSGSVTGAAWPYPFGRPKKWVPIRKPGPGGEAYNLLFQCMRFQRRDADGNPVAGAPVKYDSIIDDREPVAMVLPTISSQRARFSSPGNTLWSTIVALPRIDDRIAAADSERDEAVALLRSLVDAEGVDGFRIALVAATRWLADLDHECDY